MLKTEQTERLDYKGRTYIIHKFTPEVAGFWAIRVLGKAVKSMDSMEFNVEAIGKVIEQFSEMDFAQYNLWKKHCLSAVYAVFEGGAEHPIIHADGSYRIQELESDWTTVLLLQARAFAFTLRDFLDPSLLATLFSQAGLVGATTEASTNP